MNIIQIYDINVTNDEIQEIINKLKSVHADIERYDLIADESKFNENIKVERLLESYGQGILPITMVNGEIVKVEKHLELQQIMAQSGLSMNKLAKAGIEIKKGGCNCNKTGSCGSCGCSKDSCSTCSSRSKCNKIIN